MVMTKKNLIVVILFVCRSFALLHFDSAYRYAKAALYSNKADLSFLPESKNLLFAAQMQLSELSFNYVTKFKISD